MSEEIQISQYKEQLTCYSSSEKYQIDQKELDNNNNNDIKPHAKIFNQQGQLQVLDQSNTNQVFHYDSFLLRDQHYLVKQNQTIKALLLLFIMESLKLCFTTLLWFQFGSYFEFIAIFTFPIFLILWFLLSIINIKIIHQIKMQTLVIFILQIILSSMTLFSFTRLFKSEYLNKERIYLLLSTNEIARNLLYSMALNSIYILFIIIYICQEKNNLKLIFSYICFGIPYLILFVIQSNLQIVFLISFLYGTSLLYTIKQIQQGRFSISIGKVMQMTNVMSIVVYFPFNF